MTLSLCITFYDLDFHLLDDLLNLLKEQTLAPDEIILSSSGLSDELLKNYKTLNINNVDVSIASVNSEKRHLPGAARNLGALNSTSDYVMFLDVDDIPHPEKIKLTMEYIEGFDFLLHNYFPNCDYNSFNYSNISVCTNLSCEPECTNLIAIIPPSPKKLAIAHGPITVKRSIFNSIKQSESLNRGEDGRFCQNLVNYGYKGIFLHLPLINYRPSSAR